MQTNRRTIHRALLALAGAPALASRGAFAQQQQQPPSAPQEFRVGFQKGSALLLLVRKRPSLETRLRPLGVQSVKWVEFQFGPPMLEALGHGAIDIGSVGDTPPIFAQAGGSDIVYVAGTPSAQHAVLVPRDSPVRSLADLKGRRVAFGRGSSAHNVAIKALALAGLTLKDVVPTYLAPADATAAFNGGNIDAWVVWDPYYAIAERHYGARVLADTSDRRLASSSYYLAHRPFAGKHPAVITAAVDEIRQVTEWAGAHRADLAALAAEATGIDAPTWQAAFARAEFSVGPLTDAQIAQQQELADNFYALGIVPKKFTVRDIVWKAPAAKG
ncbi:aliphatic sulfonate ABC transporter substrate-binding protein [Xylophilus sp.]|uniref:aliphatic sulfonate ABC transporter substrate-binding protein n=1 Tax=Xylophilus sp. TaxID=2653893 RepID=UPI002D7F7A4E|nr:aliphatic sulfonate ABC transporter substrate-binding protein [Xylophilus sp.]